MPQTLRVLLAEDSPPDAELLLRELRRAGFKPEWQRVDSEADYVRSLDPALDLILSDYEMPQFNGLRAVKLLKERGLDIPLIIVSGTIGEETAVEAMRHGATDYLLKDRLTRLGPAVSHALEQNRLRREHRRSEESLKVFRALVDQSNDAFEVIDPATGRFLDVNERNCQEMGYTREELLRLTVPDIDPLVAPAEWPHYVQRIRQHGLNCEMSHRRKDGTIFPVEINARWVRLDRDYIITAVRNITERKRTEAAAAREHARFQFIFGSVPIGIAWMESGRPDSRLVNPAFARISGIAMEQSRQLELYRLGTHPEDRAPQAALHEQLMAGKIDHYVIEKRYVHADGSIHWAELTVRSFQDAAGTPMQEISTLVDLTERKLAEVAMQESEERFRQLAENIQEVFWMTDPAKNQMLYISPGYEAVWGRTCASLYALPNTWLEAIHIDDRQRVFDAAIKKQTEGTYDEVYRIIRPDGTERWIHDRAFPLRDATGQVYRIVGTAEDITKHRKLEEQYLHAQKMEAIGTLAGGIAHDFNNILAAINGYAELAKMQAAANPTLSEYLNTILHAGDRAVQLVRQILTFSREKSQQRQSVQLPEVIKESLKLLRATVPSTIEFSTRFEPQLPPILADATQIHQIIMNLGTNAWHAMRDRPGRLEINVELVQVDEHLTSIHRYLRHGPYVRVAIIDTGRGMDRATQARIFEPFFTTKGQGEGTGLGLSVVHGIMQTHDGIVTVYSEPGQGTTFHLYFPVHAGAATARAEIHPVIPQGQGKRILYLDDEEMLAILGQKTLEQLGYEVARFTQVEEALKLLSAKPQAFDLVITDQTMPGMTGLDFARRAHQLRPELPIILTSGQASHVSPEALHEAGIIELLPKPHTMYTLGTAVHRALGGKT